MVATFVALGIVVAYLLGGVGVLVYKAQVYAQRSGSPKEVSGPDGKKRMEPQVAQVDYEKRGQADKLVSNYWCIGLVVVIIAAPLSLALSPLYLPWFGG